ncbi:hypothetical protein F5Y10DRAFT_242601 [Nemania abortiva]|nr:hypothetical protein F5Y10DRAFT_242601 [Nemania abortiva]
MSVSGASAAIARTIWLSVGYAVVVLMSFVASLVGLFVLRILGTIATSHHQTRTRSDSVNSGGILHSCRGDTNGGGKCSTLGGEIGLGNLFQSYPHPFPHTVSLRILMVMWDRPRYHSALRAHPSARSRQIGRIIPEVQYGGFYRGRHHHHCRVGRGTRHT